MNQLQSGHPHQQELLDSGMLTSGFNCLLQTPTGFGKTWLAQQAILFDLQQGFRVVYLAPIRALAEELFVKWQGLFAPYSVGIFTGDYSTKYPVPLEQAQVLIMTPEKLDACLRFWRLHPWIAELSLLIVDEFHLLDQSCGRRAATLEAIIMGLQQHNPFVRVLGLSATLGNRPELADWLNALEYYSSHRPVPLSWRVETYRKPAEKPGIAVAVVSANVKQGGQSIVFVQSRKRAETVAQALQTEGIRAACHHAGLLSQDRKATESAFRVRQINAIVCTPTLEVGMNLPCNQVILFDTQRYVGGSYEDLGVNSIWQRAGRAGRPGLDSSGEVVLLMWGRDYRSTFSAYQQARFEPIRSALSNAAFLAEQILVQVASGVNTTVPQLERFFKRSLAHHQKRTLAVAEIVDRMVESGMLELYEGARGSRLRATKLGHVAVRHQITPDTVLLFRSLLEAQFDLKFMDILIAVAVCPDCSLKISIDFENFAQLNESVLREPSYFLDQSVLVFQQLAGLQRRDLLYAVHTAFIARQWTQIADAPEIARQQHCYAAEVQQIPEVFQRLLLAFADIARVLSLPEVGERISIADRIGKLCKMIEVGLDEEAISLTDLNGLGPQLARLLRQNGIGDIEALSNSSIEELTQLHGIGQKRAEKWLREAEEKVGDRFSAWRYREEPTERQWLISHLPEDVDPYLLARSRDLSVQFDPDTPLPSYIIKGGGDRHVVDATPQASYHCDCPVFQKRKTCQHIVAVLAHLKNPQIVQALSYFSDLETGQFDSFKLA